MAASVSTVGSDISQLWAATLLKARDHLLSFKLGTNQAYEGQIRNGGDTVRINTVGDITIGDHTRNSDISLQTLDTTDQSMKIDQEKEFAFFLDRVDERQAVSNIMPEAMRRAAYKMRDAKDIYIATVMAAGVATANVMTARTVGLGGSDTDAFELLVDMNTLLDVADAPEGDRFVFVPPWFAAVLVKDPRRSSFGTTENLKTYGSGYIGRTVDGLEIFKSNNIPVSGSAYTMIAGTKDATTFAEQLLEYDTVPHPLRFGKIHKGLDVYGAKVIRPTELVSVAVTASTE